ncbi:MAG: hypothetical protein ACTH31_02710 [Pseudoclavibacter sp.]
MRQILAAAFTHWYRATALDLHERFGVDTEDEAVWCRTWGWMLARITDIATDPSTRLGGRINSERGASS